jgi:hypothetical protein
MNSMSLAARSALTGMIAATIAFAPAGALAADSQPPKAGTEYVSPAGSFPKPVPRSATSGQYVPFVTDFPKPAAKPPGMPSPAAPQAGASGIDWRDVGLGGGIGAALVALLAGSALVFARRDRPVLTRHGRSA